MLKDKKGTILTKGEVRKRLRKFYLLTCTVYQSWKINPAGISLKNQGVKTLGQPTP